MGKIVVIGCGESGCGAAVLAKSRGYDVFVTDIGVIAEKYKECLSEWEIRFEEGGHTLSKILDADEAIKSPGIPDNKPAIEELRKRGIPIISEIEFAGRFIGDAKTICITGSNGKTTTSTLAHRLLSDAGYDACLCGNIGDSFAYYVATGRYDWYVLELSSFQLDGMKEFKPDIAILLNITPDHLDRYDFKLQKYADSKMQIIRNQTYDDYFIYSNDDPVIGGELPKYELPMRLLPFTSGGKEDLISVHGHTHAERHGAFMSGDDFVAVVGERKFAMPVSEMKIRGKHNVYDAMAATMAAMAAGVGDDFLCKTLTEFEGIEHRLEWVCEMGGVEWINDSKATNVDSVWFALESMRRPVVWIAGGTDKGNDYSSLMELVRAKVKTLICMGVDNSKLIAAFRGVIPEIADTRSFEHAMCAADAAAIGGDVVLLSPACASFDLFRNYEDRGQQFKEWIKTNK